jgi:hypothetical protein
MCTGLCAAVPVAADAGAGTSVTVTAVIRPVRIVVVDDRGVITRILINGPGAITPTVHRNSPDGPPAALTPSVSRQYDAIIRRVNTHKTGLIYSSSSSSFGPGVQAAAPLRAPAGPGRLQSIMLPGLRLL